MTDRAVELDRITVRIGSRQLLRPLSIGIDAGQRWVLLGPNGGGKTTLLSVIGARLQPSSGTARVLGHTVGRADMRAVRGAIGHTSHTLSELMPPGLCVLEVVLTGSASNVVRRWAFPTCAADRFVSRRGTTPHGSQSNMAT